MATAYKISLDGSERPVFAASGLSAEAAQAVTEVLQDNHDNNHVLSSPGGFHNHTVHHILTLYALGSSAASIRKHYESHKKDNRGIGSLDPKVVEHLHDPSEFIRRMANEKEYYNYLEFFRRLIAKDGHEAVVSEYLLKGDERANELLARLFGGFLHPLIHLGFGMEFNQPAIIAEALAQAALHTNYLLPFFLGAQKAASERGESQSKDLVQLLDSMREDEKLCTAAHWDDDNKIRDGILVRAPDEMIGYASQWTVDPAQLPMRTAEMINANIYYTAAAQHPPKQVKFDFYFMHCVNASIFFPALLAQPWISTANKVRLLEWKGRNDLVMYASRRCPEPLMDEIVEYAPKARGVADGGRTGEWDGVFQRVTDFPDDGHACKLVRALAHGERISAPYEGEAAFRLKKDMWLKMGLMAIDSVEDTGRNWVRSAGFEQAWEKFEDRARL